MKLPWSLSARDLIKALSSLGYCITRQEGAHIRVTTQQEGTRHVTIPDHDPVRVGTFASTLGDVADHFGLSREELLERLFG